MRCSNRKCTGKGELSIVDKFTLTTIHKPDCLPIAPIEEAIGKFKEALYSAAANQVGDCSKIYKKLALDPIHREAAGRVPYERVKRQMYQCREQKQGTQGNGSMKSLQQFAVAITSSELPPGSLENDSGVKLEAKHIDAGDGGVLVIFYNLQHAESLEASEWLFFDGTFSAIPKMTGLAQLVTIMAMKKHQAVPYAWALMSNKNEESYEALLRYVAEVVCPNLLPQHIMSDFEAAMRNVARNVYPLAEIHGCFFHYCQALRRWAVTKGRMRSVLTADAEVGSMLRKVMALALFPAESIPAAFETIQNSLSVDCRQVTQQFSKYYKNYWLKTVGSENYSVFNLEHRTNNYLESYHRQLKKIMATHPNVWTFVHKLVDILAMAELEVQQLEHCETIKKPLTVAEMQKKQAIQDLWADMVLADCHPLDFYIDKASELIGEPKKSDKKEQPGGSQEHPDDSDNA